MQDRANAIGLRYGDGSPEHVEALKSLVHAYGSLLRLGGRITGEDDLSLFGASFIAYGVDFLPKRRGDERDPLLGEWYVHE